MAEISSFPTATADQVKATTTYFVIAADTADTDTLSDDPLKVPTAILKAAIVDEETIFDIIKNIIIAGTNVTVTDTDSNNRISIASSGGSGFTPTKANIYAAVKAVLQQGTNITITADDANSELDFAITQFAPTQANIYTAVKAILQASTNVTITADDTNSELDIAASGGGGAFTPSKTNLYAAVKAILQQGTNLTITADDTNSELDFESTQFSPTKANIYAAVKAILQQGTNITITADDTDNELDFAITQFSPTKANIYAAVKAILQASTNITITADDTDNELDIAATQRAAPTQESVYDLVKEILQASTNITLTLDETNHEIDIAASGGGGGSGDITGVTAGTGLSGGAQSGVATLNLDLDNLTALANIATTDYLPVVDVSDSDKTVKALVSNILSKANIYAAVKAILQQGTNITITADDTDNELDFAITQFSPTKANIYAAVKAILQQGTNTTITPDDTNSELDFESTQFSPTQANIYTAVKEILQASTNITITADDTDHELDIASTGGSLLNAYDSGALTDNSQRSVSDTDAIQVQTLNQQGIIATENIANFGRVYKTSALKSLSFEYNFNATQGVAFQIRYSDTKPTGTSDAKSFGTQCSQVSGNVDGTCLEYDVPANRYFWFALSGGGSRTVNKRNLRVRASYTGDSFTPTKANTYAAVKAILQASTNITITADDTDNELDIAASGGGGTETPIATGLTAAQNSQTLTLTTAQQNAIRTAWLSGKDIKIVNKKTDGNFLDRDVLWLYSTGETSIETGKTIRGKFYSAGGFADQGLSIEITNSSVILKDDESSNIDTGITFDIYSVG